MLFGYSCSPSCEERSVPTYDYQAASVDDTLDTAYVVLAGSETPGSTARLRLPAMSDPIRTNAGNGVVGLSPRRFLPGKRGSL